MSTPVPLGVRIFNTWGRSFDVWVTNLVSDIQFRSVIPGGYANATLTLHNDQSNAWTQVAQPLNRIQIVDLRSQEIAWEGRIDTVPRQTSDDTWELGCLGSMVYASDIQRPMFYIDSDVGNWIATDDDLLVGTSLNSDARMQVIKPEPGTYAGPGQPFVNSFAWDGARACHLYVGRIDATFSGSASTANLRTALGVNGGIASAIIRAWNAASARLTARVGAEFADTVAPTVEVRWDLGAASQVVSSGNFGRVTSPTIQVQRVSETGAKLQTSASYPNEYLTVEQIVRDVVGRLMVGAWHTDANNTPYHGFVGSEGIFIDTSSTAQITHLTYYDGVTAAEVLNDLMTAQTNAYWALWESRYGASVDGNSDARFRFEWATWPLGWTYEASSIDGLEEQPDGGELVSFVWFQHALGTDPEFRNVQRVWSLNEGNPLLTAAELVRGVTVQAQEPMDAVPAFNRAQEVLASLQRTTNAGTLTVRRPIQAHDAGLNSNSGVSRMLDPWLLRPGKLIRITDIPPRSNSHTFAAGASGVIDTFDGRTVASTWSNAESGQPWTLAGGTPASDFSVSSGTGKHSLTSVNFSRWTTVPAPGADFDITATGATSVTPTGGSHFIYLTGRFTGTGDNYLARVEFTTTSTVALTIRKRLAGVETQLAGGTVATLTHAANRVFSVRLKAVGSSLMAKIWQASADEPTDWTTTATDTDLTEIGSVGFRSILAGTNTNPSPVTATFDNFTAVGLTAYSPELDGTVFRVVGTSYSSADNSCVLELDQPPSWNTATQVLKSGEGSSNLVVRG